MKALKTKHVFLAVALLAFAFMIGYAANISAQGKSPIGEVLEVLAKIEAKLDKDVNPGIKQLEVKLDKVERKLDGTTPGPGLEKVEAKLDRMPEVLKILEAKLDKIERKLDAPPTPGPGLENVEAKLDKMPEYFIGIAQRIGQLEIKLDKLEAKVDGTGAGTGQ